MSEQIGNNAVNRTVIENGKIYSHTVFHDDNALNQNARIRSSGMLDKAKLGLHENEDIRIVFSIPSSLQYTIFQKKHPETFKLLMSKVEHERMKGAKQMQILHPGWVVMERL